MSKLLRLALAVSIIATLSIQAHPQSEEAITTTSQITPVEVPQLGLTVRIPDKDLSHSISEIAQGEFRLRITPTTGIWGLTVRGLEVSDPRVDPDELIDFAIQNTAKNIKIVDYNKLQEKYDIRDVEIDSNELAVDVVSRLNGLEVAGLPASRVYIKQRISPDEEAWFHIGITAVKTADRRFVIFRLDSTSLDPTEEKRLTESIIASTTFRDEAAADMERGIVIQTADAFFNTLSDDIYEAALLEEPIYNRIIAEVTPEGAPDTVIKEVGFERVEIRLGQFGEVHNINDRVRWSTRDREVGYLVDVRAKLLSPIQAQTRATFFLARDRSFEAARLITQVPQRGDSDSPTAYVEEFFREGEDVVVRITSADNPTTSIEARIPDTGYLNRAELYMLPRLVAASAMASVDQDGRAQPLAYDFGFYAYDSRQSAIVFRRDSFQTTDSKQWTYTSQPFEHAPKSTATLDESGTVVRRVVETGQIIERSSAEEIQEIYKRKGIPLD